MPVFRLDDRLLFPPVELAAEGLLAVGGDLSTERLLLAYSLGIFPWYEVGQPILWHSPDPRMVLRTEELHVPRSLRKTLRQGRFRFTMDSAFPAVIGACAAAPRHGQRGTWITPQMRSAYLTLHRLGWAHSVEAWHDESLAGGVYGVSLGAIFFGESMFARAADASKAAFVALAEQLHRWGITLIDCQVYTPHLERFGATEWSRPAYVAALERALGKPTRRGPWAFDEVTVGPTPDNDAPIQ